MLQTPVGSLTDLLRLLAVPVFAIAAWKDLQTRRVPNTYWLYLGGGGLVLLLVDFVTAYMQTPALLAPMVILTALSVILVAGGGVAFYMLGAFGGADAKALMALSIWFPLYPAYLVGNTVYPLHQNLGVFSVTILVNTALVSVFTPVGVLVANVLQGEFSRMMMFGRRVWVSDVVEKHGKLLETPDGFTTSGLDVDVLTAYLEWRGITVTDLQLDSDQYQSQETTSSSEKQSMDAKTRQIQASGADYPSTVSSRVVESTPDAWRASEFFDVVDEPTYGMTPKQLRDGLTVLSENSAVWYSPGIPYIVPMFIGLLISILYGDVLQVLTHILF